MNDLPPNIAKALDSLWVAFTPLRIAFIIFDILLVGAFIYSLRRAFEVRPKFHGDWRPKKRVITLRQAMFKEKWTAIVKKFSAGSPESLRIAIIEADALADEALKQMGIAGEHMADRLSALDTEEYLTLNRIWKAHRLRNDIVHRSSFTFTQEDGQAALNDYEAFLKELHALD